MFIVAAIHAHGADVYVDFADGSEITISSYAVDSPNVIKVIDTAVVTDEINSKDNLVKSMPFNKEVMLAAKETALAPALIHAVISVESQHNPKAISKKGAYGLMQLMPETAKRFNAVSKADYLQNIMAGSRYLSELLRTFDGNLELALAAYNAGPEAVKKYHNNVPPYSETKHYVPKVMKLYQKYSG
jgi:soluble lytic murein transglycosylase-like protein